MNSYALRTLGLLSLVLLVTAGSCGTDKSGGDEIYFLIPDTVLFPDSKPAQDGSTGLDQHSLPDNPDYEQTDSDGTCLPDCDNKACGDDGCGGSCGQCQAEYHCDQNNFCAKDGCQPQCQGKFCGPDGCNSVCGTCPPDHSCDLNGICQQGGCQPQCSEKECGPDGCGAQCGQCEAGYSCKNGICKPGACSPQCAGKECGPDACGGDCGQCLAGWNCLNGTCTCTADCAGKECGDDGCGASCGTCDTPSSCNALGKCENLSCPVAGILTCGQTTAGDNTGKANNFKYYGCGFDANGPEAIYQISVAEKSFVRIIKDEPMAAKNDLYVVHADCNPNICVTNDGDDAHFTAQANTIYHVSVDGYQGAYGPFTLDVTCIPIGTCPDGKIPGCGTQCGWGHWLGDGMCSSVFDCVEMNFDNGDCD